MASSPDLQILALGRQTWAPGSPGHETWSVPHRLSHREFWIVWGGVGEISGPGFSRRLSQGTVLLLRSRIPYAVRQDPKAPLSITYFEMARGLLPKGEAFLDLPDLPLYEAVSRRILDLYWETFAAAGWTEGPRSPRVLFTSEPEHVRAGAFCPNPIRMWPPVRAKSVPALRIAAALLDVLLEDFLYRLRSVPPAGAHSPGLESHQRDLICQIAARIRENPGPLASLADHARSAGYSPDHFARVFHKVIGTSPKSFLLTARIERAKALLAQSPFTVKEIADALDYSSPYFFSRQFRAVTGLAPSEFRRREKEGS